MASKNPLSPQYPDPCAEYLYTPPPGITQKLLHQKWKHVDSRAYSRGAIKRRAFLEHWGARRDAHWEEVRKREEELQINIDAHAAAHYRRINCETVASVQGGLKAAAELAAGRLQQRLEKRVETPRADRADVEILVKAAVGSECVARVWAGFHGVVPIEADAGDVLIEFVVPPWAIEDEPEPIDPDAKIIDLVVTPPGSPGSNGSNGSNGSGESR